MTTFRQIAVSGSAAVALLGGAAAIGVASAPTASAAGMHATVEHAVTAPVTLPDGRTLRITGMGGYGHQATDEHVATVAAYKTDASPSDDPSIGTGLTPDGGAGAPLQNPINGTQTGYQQQITTQASGGYIAAGVVAILILGIVVFFKVKHGHIKAFDAVLVGLLGISLAGTVVGTMGHQITTSLIGSLGGVFGSL